MDRILVGDTIFSRAGYFEWSNVANLSRAFGPVNEIFWATDTTDPKTGCSLISVDRVRKIRLIRGAPVDKDQIHRELVREEDIHNEER